MAAWILSICFKDVAGSSVTIVLCFPIQASKFACLFIWAAEWNSVVRQIAPSSSHFRVKTKLDHPPAWD
jgi:hypothetical protein